MTENLYKNVDKKVHKKDNPRTLKGWILRIDPETFEIPSLHQIDWGEEE